jgi:membrane fusion protein, macrolide-specific efflux system
MTRRRTTRSTRPWYLYLLAAVATAAIVLGVSSLGAPATSAARTSKEVVAAADGVVQNTVSGSGNVEPGVEDEVNFETSGTLTSVRVKVGQHVKRGQLLGTLDAGSAELTLAGARDTLTSAEDQLTSAEDDTSSSKDSSESTSTTGTGTTTTTAASSSASSVSTIDSDEVQIKDDEATVTADEQALAETKLYAPVSGTVAATAGDSAGESVSAGSNSSGNSDSSSSSSTATDSAATSSTTSSAFAEIINSKTMTMTVSLSESDISSIKVGQSATVSFTALSGVELAARVTSISPLGTEDDDVVSYDATLTIYQQNSKVLPGMSATAAIITSQAQGVTVPSDAVTDASGTSGTVDVEQNGKSVSKQVVIGLKGSDRDQIISGLKAGQDVVVTETLPSLSSSSSTTSTTSSSKRSGFGASTGGLGSSTGGFGGGSGSAGPP